MLMMIMNKNKVMIPGLGCWLILYFISSTTATILQISSPFHLSSPLFSCAFDYSTWLPFHLHVQVTVEEGTQFLSTFLNDIVLPIFLDDCQEDYFDPCCCPPAVFEAGMQLWKSVSHESLRKYATNPIVGLVNKEHLGDLMKRFVKILKVRGSGSKDSVVVDMMITTTNISIIQPGDNIDSISGGNDATSCAGDNHEQLACPPIDSGWDSYWIDVQYLVDVGNILHETFVTIVKFHLQNNASLLHQYMKVSMTNLYNWELSVIIDTTSTSTPIFHPLCSHIFKLDSDERITSETRIEIFLKKLLRLFLDLEDQDIFDVKAIDKQIIKTIPDLWSSSSTKSCSVGAVALILSMCAVSPVLVTKRFASGEVPLEDFQDDISVVVDVLKQNLQHLCRALKMVSCEEEINRKGSNYKIILMGFRLVICWIFFSLGSCPSKIGLGAGFSNSTNGLGTNASFNRATRVSRSPSGSYTLLADINHNLLRHIIISFTILPFIESTAKTTFRLVIPTCLCRGSFPCCLPSFDGVWHDTSRLGSLMKSDNEPSLLIDLIFTSKLVSCFLYVCVLGYYVFALGVDASIIGVHLYRLTSNLANNRQIVDQNRKYDIDAVQGQLEDFWNYFFKQNYQHIGIRRNLRMIICWLLFTPTSSFVEVTTFAGLTGSLNGIGSNSRFWNPVGVSISPDRSYALVGDSYNHLIRHIIISTSSVTTLAGLAGTAGSTNGLGTNSRFNTPRGVSISPDGSYALVAETDNSIIRHIIISTSSVTTFAGLAGTSGSTDGIGTNARFSFPRGDFISPDGSFTLVVDTGNHLIRHIIISTSSVTTLAGLAGSAGSTNGIGTNSRFFNPWGVSISPDGSYALVADMSNHLIRHIIISTSSVTTLAGLAGTAGSTNGIGTNSRFSAPHGVSVSPDESYLLVADMGNHLIRRIIISTSSVTTLAGTVGSTDGIGTNSRFFNPQGVSISPDGSYALLCDSGNDLIRHIIVSTSSVTTLAGSLMAVNGIGSNSQFHGPIEVFISPDESFALVADYLKYVIRHIIISTSSVTTLAGLAGSAGSTNGIGTNSRFFNPWGVSTSPDRSYALVADMSNHLIRHIIISTSSVTTLAGLAGTAGSTNGIGTNSRFNLPRALARSPDGSYALVADMSNHLIRHIIISTSSVTTLAGLAGTSGSTDGIGTNSRFFSPQGISISPDGSYALVGDYSNNLIRHIIISTSSVTTFAGLAGTVGSTNGIGTNARFYLPRGVSISPDGSYALVGDTTNHLIRHIIISTSSVTTLAGLAGTSGSTNGIGTISRFNVPCGVSISPDGSYALVADYSNQLIRRIIMSPTLLPSCVPSVVPTASPSASPTLLPSCVPSVVPTASPSASPTLLPSCVPSVVPTASPSASPTLLPSCVPSVTSPTFFPSLELSSSVLPSSSPTFSFFSLCLLFIQSITSTLVENSPSQLVYYDLGLNNRQELGTCPEFDIFLNDRIISALITQVPSTIALSLVKGSRLFQLKNYSDPVEVMSYIKSVTCPDPTIISKIINQLRTFSTSPSPDQMTRYSSYTCEGNEWTVLQCESSEPSVADLLLCVNCSTKLSSYCQSSASVRSQLLSSGGPSFSISCTAYPSDNAGQLSFLTVQFTERYPPPRFLDTQLVQIANTSSTIRVVMSDAGFLSCAGYVSSSLAPTSSDRVSFGNIAVAGVSLTSSSTYPPTSTVVTYTLTDLIPSTTYNIYCTSLSMSLVPMDTSLMLTSKISMVTSCCRLLNVRLNYLVVDDISAVGLALTLDVGPVAVVDSLTVSISGVEVNTSLSRSLFSPAVVTFTATSSLSTQLTYTPVLKGTYRLSVSLSGPSSVNYKVAFPVGDLLVVKGLEDILSPPLVHRAVFTSDGSMIIVTFSSPTNRGGWTNAIFDCKVLFSSLDSGTCVWTSDTSIEILVSSVGSSSLLAVGDTLTIRKEVYKAKCTSKVDPNCLSWGSNDLQNVEISAPAVVQSPVVTLSVPSQIGPCDDLIVDVSSSSGSGGRVWKSAYLVVQGSDPNITLIRSFLSTLSMNPSSLMRSSVIVPSVLFSAGCSYSLEVTLCNFLDGCGSRLKSFVVTWSSGVPVVVLNSPSQLSIFRNTSLTISGDAYVTICHGARSRSGLLYRWSLLKGGVVVTSTEVQSVSVNPREFKLPAYRLMVGSIYQVQLEVKHSGSMKFSSISVDVFVRSGDLICEYTGGDKLGLRKEGSLLLDFSRSYDSNLNPPSSSSQSSPSMPSLSFEWKCYRTYPSYRDSCDSLILSPLNSFSSQVLATVNRSTVVSVEIGDIFEIIIIGKSPSDAQDSRRCQRVIEISILDSHAPSVVLELLSDLKMNPSSKVKILGRVDMKSRGEVRWSVSDASIKLSSVAMSPISQYLPPSPSNSPHVVSLVIVGNSLPQQSSFSFTLSCFLDNGYSSSSSMTITTNSPPFGGVLEVDPRVGVMLETVFAMYGLSWLDEDLPLSYEFGYFSDAASASTSNPSDGMIVVRSRMEPSYTSTLLPSGYHTSPSSRHGNLTCAVMVSDHLDSSSHNLFDVMIEEVNIALADLTAFLLRGINMSETSNNSDDLKSAMSNVVTLLNRVDCSGAPDCVSFNRDDCSLVQGTCGSCLEGTVGVFGPSNTPCLSLSMIDHSRHLQSPPYSQLLQQQECPNNCSGHGRCSFFSQYDTGLRYESSECSILDVACVARCECDEGFSGISCSSTSGDFVVELELRRLLVESVGDLMLVENINRRTVISWMQILSSVSPNHVGLDLASKSQMISLATQIFRMSEELGLSVQDLNPTSVNRLLENVFSSLDDVSVDIAHVSEPSSALMDLLLACNSFIASDMSIGQYPVASINTFLRSSSFALPLPVSGSSGDSSASLSIPSTDLEVLRAVGQPSINLSTGVSSPMHLSLSETRTVLSNVSEGGVQRSLPLIVSFMTPPCSAGSSDRIGDDDGCLISITLMNKLNTQSKKNDTEMLRSYEAACTLGVVENHVFACPSGLNVTISCNGSFSGVGRGTCPISSPELGCKINFQSSTSSAISQEAPVCRTNSASNETTTVCVCDLSKVSMAALSGGPITFSIMSIQKSVVKDFASTWETAPSLTVSDVAGSWQVLLTVGSLGVCFIVAVLLANHMDEAHRVVKKETLGRAVRKPLRKPKTTVGAGARFHQDRIVHEDSALIESSLPTIFKSDTLWNKFKQEMPVYHRWLGIVCHYSPGFPRSMRVLSLFSSIVIMLFVQSVTYNIADADDGSCERCEDISCCDSLRSSLNSHQNQCYWEYAKNSEVTMSGGSASDSGSCHYRDIAEDMQRMLIVAMISAVVSAPLALTIQYLVMNILSKEGAAVVVAVKDEEIKRHIHGLARVVRRSMMVWSGGDLKPSDLQECCGSSCVEDLDNLRKDLSRHHAELISSKNPSLKEFEDEWGGLLNEQTITSPGSKLKSISTSIRACLHLLFGSREISREDRARDMMRELKFARQEVLREYHRLQGYRTQQNGDPSLCSYRQRQRLVYLFVKDLAKGAAHQLIKNKDERDSNYTDPSSSSSCFVTKVPVEYKWLGWMAIILMNGGMLFYVYLFAMSQSASRQSAWFQSFVMWLFFEIFVSSTMLVLVVHIFLPLYVFTDVLRLKKKVLADFLRLRDRLRLRESKSSKDSSGNQSVVSVPVAGEKVGFNAAKYFFTSRRVAHLFSELPESSLLHLFETQWPKKRFGVEEQDISKEYEDDVILTAASQILMSFITSFLRYNSLVQDILLQTISDCGLASLWFLSLRLYKISPYLLLLAVVVWILLLHFLCRALSSGLQKRLEHTGAGSKIFPVSDNPAGSGREPACVGPAAIVISPSSPADSSDDGSPLDSELSLGGWICEDESKSELSGENSSASDLGNQSRSGS